MPTAIITGANRGLGLELARQYLAADWSVYAIGRSGSDALTALMPGHSLKFIQADLCDDASLNRAVEQIDASAIDLLVNSAGTMGDGSFAQAGLGFQAFGSFDRAEWLRIFDINVCTPMALSELLIDKLEAADCGCVVTFSSIVGSNTLNTTGSIYPYRASKSAVNSIMKSMGVNLKAKGVIAVAIHPGWVRTDMGGPKADIDAAESIAGVRTTIANLTMDDSGKLFSYEGKEMPY